MKIRHIMLLGNGLFWRLRAFFIKNRALALLGMASDFYKLLIWCLKFISIRRLGTLVEHSRRDESPRLQCTPCSPVSMCVASWRQAPQRPRDELPVAGQGGKEKQPPVCILRMGNVLSLSKILLLLRAQPPGQGQVKINASFINIKNICMGP